MQTTITITLVIKGDKDEALQRAEYKLRPIISEWFCSDVGVKPPYPEGSLLWYNFTDKKVQLVLDEVEKLPNEVF